MFAMPLVVSPATTSLARHFEFERPLAEAVFSLRLGVVAVVAAVDGLEPIEPQLVGAVLRVVIPILVGG